VTEKPLKTMVLAGGPDREHAVSLMSGAQVAAALVEAGHDVRQRQIGPEDLSALDEFVQWGGDVVFPALHGKWGEGGALQHILAERALAYVGSTETVAALCMDKHRTKLVIAQHDLPTPTHQIWAVGDSIELAPPVVIKPPCEGSSIDLLICRDEQQMRTARIELSGRHPKLLIEQYVEGREITVGVLGGPGATVALPAIEIVPATDFYDYDAKYQRNDTRYLFDIDLPASLLADLSEMAVKAHALLGCRHVSRWDFIVDGQQRPWILEVNTIPGFTSHSLVPMAAKAAGMSLAKFYDRLARLPLGDHVTPQ